MVLIDMVGTWMRLAHVALSSSGDSLDTGAFTAKDYLWVQIKRYRTGSVNSRIRVNGDSGSNYAHRYSGGANSYSESTSTTQTSIYSHAATSNESLTNYFITNKADKEKLMIIEEVNGGASGSGNAPERAEVVAKWTNTSDQITSIQCVNTDSGDLTSGTYITVFGASDDVVTDEKTTLEDATATVSPISITSATGWDTTNAGSNLSIDSSGKITQGNMTANGRLTYDLGSNLQGTWTIDYDFQRTSSSGGNVRPMAVATNTGSINDSGVDNNAVGQYGDTNFNAFKKEGTNADSAQGWIAGTTDMRYIRLSRTSATNFRMEVFTDSDRTTYDTSSCGGGCSGNSGIINQTISLTGGLRYLVSGNGDAGSSHTGTIENIKVYDGAIAGTTVSSPPPANTRYEEIDTRKIYRRVAGGTTSQETQNGGELFNDVEIVSQKFTSGSSKIGLIVDSVDVFIRNDTGSVSTSTNIECKIGQEWSSGVSYGTKSPSALSTSYSWQNFTPASAKRTIVENDRLMIRWADGTVTDHSIRWGSDNNASNQLPNETGEYSSDDGSNWTARSFDRCYKINYSAQWKERGTA